MQRSVQFSKSSIPVKSSKEQEDHVVNEAITAREVRLIDHEGKQVGIIRTIEALRMAEDLGLDLVQVAADAMPPVCRILDYGKLKYREQKKSAEARKKNAAQETKELRVRYNTDSHDLETKIRNARRFLEEGDKVKFQMRFKGREVVYEEIGNGIFDQIAVALEDISNLDERTNLIGSRMFIGFAPKSVGKKNKAKAAQTA
ncbi:MAG: translation initiation factor IF-3 [Deltaproteobacteria bacterium]|nr:translation initiation factor IF-3 [Deltaproteobacteria bacterium]